MKSELRERRRHDILGIAASFLCGMVLLFAVECAGGKSSVSETVIVDDDNDDNDLSPSDDEDNDDDMVWSQMSGEFPPLNGVWGSSPMDVYAVGDGSGGNGSILHFDGAHWANIDTGLQQASYRSVFGTSPSDVFVCGQWPGSSVNDLLILRYDGRSWSPTDVSGFSKSVLPEISAIWGLAASDFYAVGDGEGEALVGHFDGSEWSLIDGNFQVTFPGSLAAIWGSSASDIFVGGGCVAHFDGTAWSIMPGFSSGTSITSIWGRSPSDVFAAGGVADGTDFFHYDGLSWTVFDADPRAWFNSLWGSSSADVFAAGCTVPGCGADAIDHFDGSAWSTMTSGTFPVTLFGIWGASPTDVFAVGEDNNGNGGILHYGPTR